MFSLQEIRNRALLTGSMKAMISSSLRIPELDFLGRFGGRDLGRGGREVTTGSNFILRARLSREPLLLFSFFVDNSSLVPSVVLMVRGVVASLMLLLLLLLLAVARSRLLEVLKLQFEEILSLLLSRLLEETKLEETRSSTVVGTAKVVLANSATVRGTLEKVVNGM